MTPIIQKGAHALLIAKDGKVLLVSKGPDYKYDRNNAGKVAMFGGGLEEGEEPLAALKRELLEELGLDIIGREVKKLNDYKKTVAQDGVDVEVHVYVVAGVDPAMLDISRAKADDIEAAESIIEGRVEELLARSDLTRITKLALQDYKSYG